MPAVAAHWRAFFAAEPGAEVAVHESDGSVTVEVKVCPLIKHLRDNKREIVPCLCQHCYFVSDAIGEPAGVTVRVTGGDGSCRQTFHRRDSNVAAQNLNDIKEATSC
jgi:hypothetical protein